VNPPGPSPSRAGTVLGREGEERAARLLEAEGFRIVARNYRTRGGEIDIIASKGCLLVFVEVKTWRYMGFDALEDLVGAEKRKRIVETSKIFLARNREYSNAHVRYDLILFGGDWEARRIESAFTGEL
jgi:putative endonuclease